MLQAALNTTCATSKDLQFLDSSQFEPCLASTAEMVYVSLGSMSASRGIGITELSSTAGSARSTSCAIVPGSPKRGKGGGIREASGSFIDEGGAKVGVGSSQ